MILPGWYYHIKEALESGYRVDLETGEIYGKYGRRVLKPAPRPGKGTQYRQVTLCVKGRPYRNIAVYKIIAYARWGEAAFAPGAEVRHLDNNSFNDHPSNLALGTRRDNIMDKPAELRRKGPLKSAERHRGRPNCTRKLSDAQVLEIVARRRSGERSTDLAREYGIDQAVVSRILHGKQYPSVTKGVLPS